MRVAVLMTGQMRRYTDADVLNSLHNYFSMFDSVDIFVSTWSDRGVSYNHGQVVGRGDAEDTITEADVCRVFPQTRGIRIHDLKTWATGLEGCRKAVYTEGFEWRGMRIRGTVVPQLFGLWDANRIRLEYETRVGVSYDLVIRCRPDCLFVPHSSHSRDLYESVMPNTIYAINNRASGTYYPQRIYDIFFFGTPAAMDSVCRAYEDFEALIGHPWDNGLHARDACRCLYVQARFRMGMAVVDLGLDVCTVKR